MARIWYPVNHAAKRDVIFPLKKQRCFSVNMSARDSLSPEKNR